jgi:hypothetical protein
VRKADDARRVRAVVCYSSDIQGQSGKTGNHSVLVRVDLLFAAGQKNHDASVRDIVAMS